MLVYKKSARATLDEIGKRHLAIRLAKVGDNALQSFLSNLSHGDFLRQNNSGFFEMRRFLSRAGKMALGSLPVPSLFYQQNLEACHRAIDANCRVVPIASLAGVEQEDAMRFIFRNEDKVWRDRGGRPGHETVEEVLQSPCLPVPIFLQNLHDWNSASQCSH
jgi:hypothetical protein